MLLNQEKYIGTRWNDGAILYYPKIKVFENKKEKLITISCLPSPKEHMFSYKLSITIPYFYIHYWFEKRKTIDKEGTLTHFNGHEPTRSHASGHHHLRTRKKAGQKAFILIRGYAYPLVQTSIDSE